MIRSAFLFHGLQYTIQKSDSAIKENIYINKGKSGETSFSPPYGKEKRKFKYIL